MSYSCSDYVQDVAQQFQDFGLVPEYPDLEGDALLEAQAKGAIDALARLFDYVRQHQLTTENHHHDNV